MEPKKNPAKDVHQYSKHFFLIGFIISCSIAIMAFEWETQVVKTDCRLQGPKEYSNELYPIPVTVQHHVTPDHPRKKIALLDPSKLVPDIQAMDPDDSEPETVTEHFADGEQEEFPVEIEKEVPPDTFIIVEQMPVPAGGYESFYKQVARSMKYPIIARRTNTEGKVFIEFVINKNGTPVNLKVIKGIGQGCDEEAKRVISMTKWEPGKQRGQPTLVKMTLPVFFHLE